MKKQNNSFEVTLTVNRPHQVELDILRELLIRLGVRNDKITELTQDKTSCLSVYFTTSKEALRLKRKLNRCRLKQVSIQSKTIKTRDWLNLWKKDYKPFQLTKGFEIVPFAYRSKHQCKTGIPIYIDTSNAFGTGLHATTRFVAQFIERCAGKFESFFDIGTGTGILSIVALKCGARDIRSIDLKKDIVAIANNNFKENGFPKQKATAINFKKVKVDKKYDYVAANLVTQDLIAFRRKLVSLVKPGQYLAVSGISLNNYPQFREAFDGLPLRCIKSEKGEGWYALLYKKL